MKTNKQQLLLAGAVLATMGLNSVAFASSGVSDTTAVENIIEAEVSIDVSSNPSVHWNNFLSNSGLAEGWNNLPNGKSIFIAKGEATVGKPLTDKDFILSRNMAYDKAYAFALEGMASSLKSISSQKIMFKSVDNANQVPPSLSTQETELSVFDKVNTLTHAQLDSLIKGYDPTWGETKVTNDERKAKIISVRETFNQRLTEKTQLWLQGSAIIFNAEGPDMDGMYSAVVGTAFSPAYSSIVANMIDPSRPAPTAKPKKPIIAQINDKLFDDKDWLSKQYGIRVMTDENGQRVLVSFANNARNIAKRSLQRKTTRDAKAQIERFVSSKLAASNILDKKETIDYNDDETLSAYNQSSFNEEISIVSKTLVLEGTPVIKTWTSNHKNSTMQKLYGVVMTWSPSTRDASKKMQKTIKDNLSGTKHSPKTNVMKNRGVKDTGKQKSSGYSSGGVFDLSDF